MTQQELKRLSRAELLEIILLQIKENKELQEEVSTLRAQLDDRTIAIAESGNIAEAALRLSRVFQAAEAAVAQYKENIRRMSSEQNSFRQPRENDAERQTEPFGE